MQKSSAFEFVMNGNAGWTPNLIAASDNIAVLNGAFDALYKPTVSVVYRNAKLIFCKLRRTITSAGLCSQHAKVSLGHGSRQPDDPFYDSQRSATWITTICDLKQPNQCSIGLLQTNIIAQAIGHIINSIWYIIMLATSKTKCYVEYCSDFRVFENPGTRRVLKRAPGHPCTCSERYL